MRAPIEPEKPCQRASGPYEFYQPATALSGEGRDPRHRGLSPDASGIHERAVLALLEHDLLCGRGLLLLLVCGVALRLLLSRVSTY